MLTDKALHIVGIDQTAAAGMRYAQILIRVQTHCTVSSLHEVTGTANSQSQVYHDLAAKNMAY